MGGLIDLTGQRFGYLRVLRRAGTTSSIGAALWACVCDCGNTSNVASENLRGFHTRSCGCYKIEMTKRANSTHKKSLRVEIEGKLLPINEAVIVAGGVVSEQRAASRIRRGWSGTRAISTPPFNRGQDLRRGAGA